MSKQTPKLEWIVEESEAEWERLQTLLPLELTPALRRRLQLKRTLWSMATVLLLLVVIGEGWRRTTQAKLQADEADLRTVVAQKPLALVTPDGDALIATIKNEQTRTDATSHDAGREDQVWQEYEWKSSGLPASVRPDDPMAPLGATVQSMELLGNQAIANVILNAQNGKPAYRQTRFYRHTDTGWQESEPDATLWGAEQQWETPYFVFHFRQNDAPAVMAVAPALDALYLTLQRNFGMLLTPGAEKMIIEVRVTQTPGHGDPSLGVGFDGTDRLIVPSPARYLAPVELTDVALLEQSLALPLLAAVLTRARQQYAIGSAQQPLLNGLRLWQLWDLDLPLAVWREEVVQWLYLDPTVAIPGRPVVLPERYAELCSAHKLWLPSPAELNIPLVCIDLDQELWFFFAWGLGEPPTRLEHVILSISSEEEERLHRGQSVALATLIEYAVVTYGRERLPVLIAGLGQNESWATLIPAVYGVSTAEFEAGWQAYLAARYGVSPDIIMQ